MFWEKLYSSMRIFWLRAGQLGLLPKPLLFSLNAGSHPSVRLLVSRHWISLNHSIITVDVLCSCNSPDRALERRQSRGKPAAAPSDTTLLAAPLQNRHQSYLIQYKGSNTWIYQHLLLKLHQMLMILIYIMDQATKYRCWSITLNYLCKTYTWVLLFFFHFWHFSSYSYTIILDILLLCIAEI